MTEMQKTKQCYELLFGLLTDYCGTCGTTGINPAVIAD